MAPSQEEIQALADAVSVWRMQETIYIAFFALYAYYVLLTVDEEVAYILPEKWTWGKILFLSMRYGTCAFIGLHLSRDYRNYYTLSEQSCKALVVAYDVAHGISRVAYDASLGMCLGALLQVGLVYYIPLMIISTVPTIISIVFTIVSAIQYPTEPVSALDIELGYACYVVANDGLWEQTISGLGRNVRSYLNFGITTFLLIVAIITLIVRYKGNHGPLIQVLRRDGGMYCVAFAALRTGAAILKTPAVLATNIADDNPATILFDNANFIIIPILAQRLLINMRKVDYMGSQPFASQLLFSPPDPEWEDSFDSDPTVSTRPTAEKTSANHPSRVEAPVGSNV